MRNEMSPEKATTDRPDISLPAVVQSAQGSKARILFDNDYGKA